MAERAAGVHNEGDDDDGVDGDEEKLEMVEIQSLATGIGGEMERGRRKERKGGGVADV